MMDMLFNTIGITGMACFLSAYYFLQKGSYRPDDYRYLILNLAGAVLIIVSLLWDWNLSAFLLEAAWFLITSWGLFKRWQRDRTITP
ncbi:MAG: hypothetical protein AB7F82_02605 [Alphaproteobacteria bacterium]